MAEPRNDNHRERGPMDALNDMTGGALVDVLKALTELFRTANPPGRIGEADDLPADGNPSPGEPQMPAANTPQRPDRS